MISKAVGITCIPAEDISALQVEKPFLTLKILITKA